MKTAKIYLEDASLIPVLSIMEKWYTRANTKLFGGELPPCTITIQRDNKTGHNTHGWMSCAEVWHKGDQTFNELNMTAHSLSRPIEESITTLIHEMCHRYALLKGEQDTSRNGKYHNNTFKAIAESHGLECPEKDPKIGWSHTVPTDELIEWINSFDHRKDDEELKIYRDRDMSVKKTSKKTTYKYICPKCGAIVRSTKEVNLMCADCMELFELAESRD